MSDVKIKMGEGPKKKKGGIPKGATKENPKGIMNVDINMIKKHMGNAGKITKKK
jgi:hypothetical protein